jgi:hypothetical protein
VQPRQLISFIAHQHFLLLVVSLVAVLLIEPFIADHGSVRILFAIFFSFIPFGVVYAVGSDKKQRVIALFLGIIFLILLWLNALLNNTMITNKGVLIVTAIFHIFFYVFVIASIVRYLVKAKKISADAIFAAVAGYLLIGFLWASLYGILGSESFSNTPQSTDVIYYSFTTLTTLGIGDFTPLTTIAKRASMLEAVVGVLYTTIIIALIVGIYLTDRLKRSGENS